MLGGFPEEQQKKLRSTGPLQTRQVNKQLGQSVATLPQLSQACIAEFAVGTGPICNIEHKINVQSNVPRVANIIIFSTYSIVLVLYFIYVQNKSSLSYEPFDP